MKWCFKKALVVIAVGLVTLSISFAAQADVEKKVDINSATVKELRELEGVGKTLAERIVEYREEHGPFRDVSELSKVKGIGKARYERMKDRVTAGNREKAEVGSSPDH